MRGKLRAAGWSLVAAGVIAVSVVVIVGATRAHGDAAFNRWVGWATIDAVPFTAIGIVLVLLEKISRVHEKDSRKIDGRPDESALRGIQGSGDDAPINLGQLPDTEPHRRQIHSLAPAHSTIRPAADPPRLNRKVTLWGPRASGKTTYLAALNTALEQALPPWTLTGADPVSTERLIQMTASMVGRRQFPAPTFEIEIHEFVMAGELETNGARGLIRRWKRAPIQFDLSVVDTSGETYRVDRHWQQAELVTQLAHSDGIIFFFDPLWDALDREAYENFQATAARLEHEMGMVGSSRLPHHVAVCIVKLDEPRVFSAARDAGYLVIDSDESYGFPKVADDRAADFFDELYRKFNPPGAPLLRHTIERYFRKDRIRYFAVSSIGFHLNESMRFNPDDYYNLIARRSDNSTIPGDATLRGNIYPVNVLEPLLWLAAPARYEAALRRRHHDFMHLGPRPEEARPARQSEPATAAIAPGMVSITRPGHLICLVEISGTDEAVAKRLGRLLQLVGVVAEINPELPVSLISYGTHSFSPSQREEPVTVLAWALDSTAALQLFGSLVHNRPADPEFRLGAQIECALSEVARRLSETQECVALVTVGSLPAFPPWMAPDSRTLPCPSRNNWQEILEKLQTHPGVVLGAIEDLNSDGGEIWARLGTDAIAHLDDVDISRFAASLGLGYR